MKMLFYILYVIILTKAMELILENKSKFNITWSSNAIYHNGEYFTGPTGQCGVSCSRNTIHDDVTLHSEAPSSNTSFPNTISIYVTFKEHDEELYNKIISQLRDVKDINVTGHPANLSVEKFGVKIKYLGEVQKITEQNNYTMERFKQLCDELEKMGCDAEDLAWKGPRLIPIPDEYYITDTKVSAGAYINIICHNGTQVYQFFRQHNLL